MNRKALIGKHKYVYDGVRSLFELGTDSCQNLYQTYIGDALAQVENLVKIFYDHERSWMILSRSLSWKDLAKILAS